MIYAFARIILVLLCAFLFVSEGVRLRKLQRSRSVCLNIINSDGKGFGVDKSVPRPNIIKPSLGSNKNVEKFLMMYTCKICNGRNANMVSKVAYNEGLVVATCRHCKNKHLIADNQRKLDFPTEFGKKIEEYLVAKGETVQKMSITSEDLEDNYLVDNDGVLSLFPKVAGQPEPNVNIIDFPPKKSTKNDGQ